MATFSAKDVQTLRQSTGAEMMDAKQALTENDGDFEAAAKWLREKGLGKAAERSGRENTQGAIAAAMPADGVAAIVELKCETDFVAKSDGFTAVAEKLAGAVAADGEAAVERHKDLVDDLKVTLKENIEVGRVVRIEAADGNALDAYLHRQDGRGVNAVVVEVAGGDARLAHDLAVHVAFAQPPYLSRDEVPAAEVEAERATLEQLTRAEGKPEAAVPKIVEGRLGGWFRDRVLLEQAYVRDEKQSIAHLLGDARIVRFAQVVIGR
ncbi:translation elongation factor Ts [soil metagenome]